MIEAYEANKRELGLLDFDDLLIRARDLLSGPHGKTLQQQLSASLTLLLVDEFQDTDPLQVELVKSLCGERLLDGKLFFVGDSKQSIYRFRGADPRVFRQLRDEIPQRGRLPLTLNFRSQRPILEFVNAMFCERLGPDYEALEAAREPLFAAAGSRVLVVEVGRGPGRRSQRRGFSQLRRGVGRPPLEGDLRVPAQAWICDEQTKQARPVEPRRRGDFVSLAQSTSSITRRRCDAMTFRTTWSEDARFIASRKSSTC